MKKLLCFLLALIVVSVSVPQRAYCAASEEPVPYEDSEFPQWALDLRRFEVISLGSVPFAMIGVTLIYGAIEINRGNRSSMPNPLNPGDFGEYGQLKVLGMTLLTGVCIATIDLTANKIKKYRQRKEMERINASKQVDIIPLYENSVETETVEDDNYVTDDNGTQ